MNTKTKFLSRYPGPKGPHLNHLTHTSLTGTYKEEDQKSIHPSVRRRSKKPISEVNASEVTL